MSDPGREPDYRMQQELEEERLFSLLEALQRIDRAGFHDEALLLAFEGGVLQQFRKQQEISHATNQ